MLAPILIVAFLLLAESVAQSTAKYTAVSIVRELNSVSVSVVLALSATSGTQLRAFRGHTARVRTVAHVANTEDNSADNLLTRNAENRKCYGFQTFIRLFTSETHSPTSENRKWKA